MANGWTLERRTRQSAAKKLWQPWSHSTGPKTEQGKTKVGRNAFKGGWCKALRAEARAVRDVLAQ
jgi:hypothetical protein